MQLSEKSIKCVVLLLILIISWCSYSPHAVQRTFAISPSFVKQEIVNAPHNWQFWKDPSQYAPIITHDGHLIEIQNAKSMPQCKTQKLLSPKISSVSYISDGRLLNGTLWLTDKFEEPHLNDSIDIYPSYLEIKRSNLSKTITASHVTLENYIDEKIGSMFNPFNNFTIEVNKTATTISGNKAYKLVYSGLAEDGIKEKNMTFWTMNNGKLYDITYSAMYDRYSSNIPIIQKMISSFEIEGSPYNYNNNGIHGYKLVQKTYDKGYGLFKGLGIQIAHPNDWKAQEIGRSDSKGTSIIFQSPFEDEALQVPSWHEIKFGTALAIDSVQHPAVTDYRIEYSREPNNNTITSSNSIIRSWDWNKKFYEVSAADRTRVLEEWKKDVSFYKKDDPYYIFFSVDLSKINFPKQYRAVFYIVNYFVLKHHMCRLVDTTPWVIIPPPQFTISTITPSNPLELRPGEERNIEVTIKGNTHLPSEAFLTPTYYSNNNNNISYSKKVIQASFTPNTTSIIPYGSGTSTLRVKALDNTSESNPYAVTIPVSVNISFPTTITNRAGEIFNNSKSENILQTSNLTLTILPPYTLGENFNKFVSTWVTPVSGMWTFLAGVAAVLGPLIIRIYKKKSNK
jgi:hypothetical protein